MDPASIHKVEGLLSDLKQSLKQDDPVRMKKLTQDLTQALHALSQGLYNKTDASGHAGQAGSQGSTGAKPADDDIVDAEFSEVA